MKAVLKRHADSLAKLLVVLLISAFSFALGSYIGFLVQLEQEARIHVTEPMQ